MENIPLERRKAFGAPVEIHFFYVVLILGMALILVATREWTAIEKFTDYLTAAGTMSSLVLGVLAIIYSFVSSRQQSDVLGSIESASRNVSQVVGQMNALTISAESLQNRAETRTESMIELVSQLRVSLDSLQTTTQELTSKSEDIAGKVGSVQSQLESMGQSSKSPLEDGEIWNEKSLGNFLQNSSVWGLCAITLIVQANKSADHILHVAKYSENGGPKGVGYLQGYLVCLDAAGMFDISSHDGGTDLAYKLNEINPLLEKSLETAWSRRYANARPALKTRWDAYKLAAAQCVS
jgi:hypothetical protein